MPRKLTNSIDHGAKRSIPPIADIGLPAPRAAPPAATHHLYLRQTTLAASSIGTAALRGPEFCLPRGAVAEHVLPGASLRFRFSLGRSFFDADSQNSNPRLVLSRYALQSSVRYWKLGPWQNERLAATIIVLRPGISMTCARLRQRCRQCGLRSVE